MQAEPNVSHLIREKSLIRALARAISIIELIDLPAAIDIVGELEGDLAPLVGGPIILSCDKMITFVEPLAEPICIFGDVCAHRSGGAA